MPELSPLLLCPRNGARCADQDFTIYDKDDEYFIKPIYIGMSSYCWYRFVNLAPDVAGITLFNFTKTPNTMINIYTDDKKNIYKYVGKVENTEEVDAIYMSYNNVFYVLILSNGKNSYY